MNYTIDNIPLFYDTRLAIIKFDKEDVVEYIRKHLETNEEYSRQAFFEYLINSNDIIIIKSDTVYNQVWDTVPSILWGGNDHLKDTIILVPDKDDKRNHYGEFMFWVAYDLIRKGKCEIKSKIDNSKIKKIKVVYNKVPINTKYTEFFFENDTLFFSAITQLGL